VLIFIGTLLGRVALAFVIIFAALEGASSHDQWSDGNPVPPWVKASCCGPEDVHHLTKDQVHTTPDGYRIDGYPDVIPYARELPSEDGEFWAFYKSWDAGGGKRQFSMVYCFFAPPRSF
jgi:hypothetical protein